MIEIPVAGSIFPAIVDDEDAPLVLQYKWHLKDGYAKTSVRENGKRFAIYMHRFVMGVTERRIYVDHKHGNRLDNRKEHLRATTPLNNARNKACSIRSTSGYIGVSWHACRNKWRASINLPSEITPGRSHTRTIGRYDNELMAAFAYNKEAKRHFGEFARLNNIPSTLVECMEKVWEQGLVVSMTDSGMVRTS